MQLNTVPGSSERGRKQHPAAAALAATLTGLAYVICLPFLGLLALANCAVKKFLTH